MTVAERARHDVASRSTIADPESMARSLPTVLAFIGAFIAVWAAYFTIAAAPVAINHDMSEAYAWGNAFQLGYNQHPPFWAWVCGLWFSLFPRTGWAFALLSSVNAGIGLWGAWMLIGDFVRDRKRIAACALLLVTPLYTFYAYKYNANIIFLSIWPWTLHYFMRSLQSRGTGDAIGLGVCVGLAMMSKYYALILIASCLLAALQHPLRWRYFASASPYIAAIVAVAICTPHIWWLLTNGAPPLRYFASTTGRGWHHVLLHAWRATSGAVGMNLGVVAVVGLVAWTSRRDGRAAAVRDVRGPTLRVLATLALAPFVLTIISALLLRNTLTTEMTVGTFPLVPLLMIEIARIRNLDRLCWVSTRLALAVTLGSLALSPVAVVVRVHLSPATKRVAPFQEVAIEATRQWHERTSLPLTYVGGTGGYANAATFYSPDRPYAFVHFDYSRNLWVTPEAIARHGLLSICVSDDSVCLAETGKFVTPETRRSELTLAHSFWGWVANPVHFVVTVVPPQR